MAYEKKHRRASNLRTCLLAGTLLATQTGQVVVVISVSSRRVLTTTGREVIAFDTQRVRSALDKRKMRRLS